MIEQIKINMAYHGQKERTTQLNARLSEAELQTIDDFKDKINTTKRRWEAVSRIDAILAAIKFANGVMFPLEEK